MISKILPVFITGCAAVIGIAVVHRNLERNMLMGLKNDLSAVRDKLVEALNEILAKLANNEDVSSVVEDLQRLSTSLADIVPGTTPGENLKPIVPGENLKPIVPGEELTPLD